MSTSRSSRDQAASMHTRRSVGAPGYVGLALSLLACALFVTSVFAPYLTSEFGGWYNLWHLEPAEAVARLALTGTALAAFLVSFFAARTWLALLGLLCNTCTGALALGWALTMSAPASGHYLIAYYLGILGLFLGVVAGILAIYGYREEVVDTSAATAAAPIQIPQAAAPLPPTGWYPDPSTPGRLRLWAGHYWTAETIGP